VYGRTASALSPFAVDERYREPGEQTDETGKDPMVMPALDTEYVLQKGRLPSYGSLLRLLVARPVPPKFAGISAGATNFDA
jgi:hypothetical protein